jgi:hypothetical protein
VVREFRISPGCAKEFARVFGPDGEWAGLLRLRSRGYVATELRVVSAEGRRYEVRDCWRWHHSFELFREVYQRDLERFHDGLTGKGMIEEEVFLGAFYSGDDCSGDDEDDEGDDAGLVSA